jgi:hypothetical protein
LTGVVHTTWCVFEKVTKGKLHFEYVVMPFGFMNALAIFQHLSIFHFLSQW